MEKLTINQWAEEDRPREKMMLKGAEAFEAGKVLHFPFTQLIEVVAASGKYPLHK
jgi:DNA repair protein RadC